MSDVHSAQASNEGAVVSEQGTAGASLRICPLCDLPADSRCAFANCKREFAQVRAPAYIPLDYANPAWWRQEARSERAFAAEDGRRRYGSVESMQVHLRNAKDYESNASKLEAGEALRIGAWGQEVRMRKEAA